MMNRYKAFNFLIMIIVLFFVVSGSVVIFLYKLPTNLKEITGTVQEYNQRDEKWYDSIFNNSAGSYFNVRLEDDSFFEAKGICYNNIDKTLFEKLHKGDEITITYNDEIGRPDRIYAIEFNNEVYLSIDDVLFELEEDKTIMQSVGAFMIATSISAGVILFIINYKRNRGK